MDLLAILRGKSPLPNLQSWLTWGQSKALAFPVPAVLLVQSTGQLVRAQRNPPTTWTVLTTFRFSTTQGDFGNAQVGLRWGVKYTVGLGQTQTDVTRTFRFATDFLSDAVILVQGPPTVVFGVPDANADASLGTNPPSFTTHTIIEQVPAEDLQVQATVSWTPNAAANQTAVCVVSSFAAPLVY